VWVLHRRLKHDGISRWLTLCSATRKWRPKSNTNQALPPKWKNEADGSRHPASSWSIRGRPLWSLSRSMNPGSSNPPTTWSPVPNLSLEMSSTKPISNSTKLTRRKIFPRTFQRTNRLFSTCNFSNPNPRQGKSPKEDDCIVGGGHPSKVICSKASLINNLQGSAL
jgi:hypothetical protein